MFSLLKNIFSGKDRSLSESFKNASFITEVATKTFGMGRDLGFRFDRFPNNEDAHFLLGYICGFCDVFAQHLTKKGSHGNASINGILGVVNNLFEERGEMFMNKIVSLMEEPSKNFSAGAAVGGDCANKVLQGDKEASLQVMYLFSEHYKSYCIK